MLSYEGEVSSEQNDKLTVTFNDEAPQSYSSTFFSSIAKFSDERNLMAGTYNITFEYLKDAYNAGGDDRAILKNVKLKLIELKDDNALLDTDTVDFGLVQSK